MTKHNGGTPFAQRLAEVLRQRRMTQAALAIRLSVTEGAVSKWINDEREPPLGMLIRIHEVLGTSVDWLLGLPAAPPPPFGVSDPKTIRRAVKALRDAGAAAEALAELLPPEEA